MKLLLIPLAMIILALSVWVIEESEPSIRRNREIGRLLRQSPRRKGDLIVRNDGRGWRTSL